MTSRPSSPRIAPRGPADRGPEVDELLQSVARPGGHALNIFATLVRHPGLCRRWLPFGGKLLDGKLAPRERELASRRTGWRCQAVYEWGQHVLIGREAGLTDDEIRR